MKCEICNKKIWSWQKASIRYDDDAFPEPIIVGYCHRKCRLE